TEIIECAGALDAEIASYTRGADLQTARTLLGKLEAAILRASINHSPLSLEGLEEVPGVSSSNADPEPFSFDISDFSDKPADPIPDFFFAPEPEMLAIQEPEVPMVETPADTHTGEDEFEIDRELLEVFAEEAEDLLKNIDASLETLARDP